MVSQPEPLKNLNELAKAQVRFTLLCLAARSKSDLICAQLLYYSAAAEALSACQGEIEELSVAAEGEYRFGSRV
jgi:hypothetical protein